MELTKRDKVKIFNDAAKYSYLETGYNNDMDKFYSSDASIRTTVGRIVAEVMEHHESFDISEDKVKMVRELIDERSKSGNTKPAKIYNNKKIEEYLDKPLMEVVSGNRDMLSAVLQKKLRFLMNNDKDLKNTSLSQISSAFDTMFDKSQILQGRATENISFQGTISSDMDPDEAIKAVVKMRESNVQDTD
jgi:predicted DNA-binding WGR domain protein